MRHHGFTLIELMIVVAIIAIIAAIAIPGLLRSKISTHESAVLATCKTIASAQSQFKVNATVDQDSDGDGEYGFLSEVAGIGGFRVDGGLSALPYSPASLPQQLGVVTLGSAQKSGYEFRVYLPSAGGTAMFQAAQVPPNGARVEAAGQEVRWCCYAWPQNNGQTGRRAYCVNQGGEVMATANTGASQAYNGKNTAPSPGAAYDAAGTAPANLDAALARTGVAAVDGGTWAPGS